MIAINVESSPFWIILSPGSNFNMDKIWDNNFKSFVVKSMKKKRNILVSFEYTLV
jgi:hypothetical protein